LPTEIPVDPKTLTQQQLSSLLSDKNRENVGRDKNAELLRNQTLLKDSTKVDNIRSTFYSPDQTYGANIFETVGVTDLSELSTPTLDYPIDVGDRIIVALWGAAEFQEVYVVARDGSIFPQGLGKIHVAGLTFNNVRSIVQSRFRSVVPAG